MTNKINRLLQHILFYCDLPKPLSITNLIGLIDCALNDYEPLSSLEFE